MFKAVTGEKLLVERSRIFYQRKNSVLRFLVSVNLSIVVLSCEKRFQSLTLTFESVETFSFKHGLMCLTTECRIMQQLRVCVCAPL